MQSIQQVFNNPLYFQGLRDMNNLPSKVIVVDKDKVHYAEADYTSIQEAIENAENGDFIFVFPGLYEESITISKELKVYGNGAYINPTPTGRAGGEATISNQYPVSIMNGNVIFSGFEIIHFETAIGIPEAAFTQHDTIEHVKLSYHWIHEKENVWVGINAQGGHLKHYEITNSIIDIDNMKKEVHEYALAGINFSGHQTLGIKYENITIRNNILRNSSGYYNLFAGAAPDKYTIDSMVIECNHFMNNKKSILADGANYNIGNISNGRFESNVVEDVPGSIGIENGIIKGNSFIHGGGLKLWGTEHHFIKPTQNITIENNEFSNEVFGNGIHYRTGVTCDKIKAIANAFLESGIEPVSELDPTTGYSIRNDTDKETDAVMNWWGSPDGPRENSCKIYGSVATYPWIRKYEEDKDKKSKLCWPLSLFRKDRPGFYPCIVTGINYIGETCFDASECVELVAMVKFQGGNGKNIPVKFILNDCEYHTCTAIGGYASVKIGGLCRGVYTLKVQVEERKITTTIYVKCHCER